MEIEAEEEIEEEEEEEVRLRLHLPAISLIRVASCLRASRPPSSQIVQKPSLTNENATFILHRLCYGEERCSSE